MAVSRLAEYYKVDVEFIRANRVPETFGQAGNGEAGYKMNPDNCMLKIASPSDADFGYEAYFDGNIPITLRVTGMFRILSETDS